MKTVIFQLNELQCPSCVQKIEKIMATTSGVQTVKMLFNVAKLKIVFDEKLVSIEQLREILSQEGYPVISIKTAS